MTNSHTLDQPRSAFAAFALWFFFGTIGIHRFYLRRRFAIPMLILGGFAWIANLLLLVALSFFGGVFGFFLLLPIFVWWLVDLFLVDGWVREHNAALGHG